MSQCSPIVVVLRERNEEEDLRIYKNQKSPSHLTCQRAYRKHIFTHLEVFKQKNLVTRRFVTKLQKRIWLEKRHTRTQTYILDRGRTVVCWSVKSIATEQQNQQWKSSLSQVRTRVASFFLQCCQHKWRVCLQHTSPVRNLSTLR